VPTAAALSVPGRAVALPAFLTLFRLAVGALTAGVAGFLLTQLQAWPPHEDEALALFVSRQPLGDLVDTVLGERGGAPLHFLLTHLVGTVSPGLTGLRLLSVLFAVASIPVIACLAARLTNRTTALVTTLLVATSWTLLFHGIYGRMYSLFLFTSALSFLMLLHALAYGGRRRWALWAVAMLAAIASMPYGAMVLAVQAAYVIARRFRQPFSLRPAIVSFAAVTLIAIPLWRTYLVLASRFDVGIGGDRTSSLKSPYDVLVYIREVIGDFAAGWTAVFALVVALAALGLLVLVLSRPPAALLAGLVFAVPTAALMLARLGSAAVPETRHLIFALPFFAMLVAAGLVEIVRRAGPAGASVLWLGLAALVAVQIAWGWQRTPALYAGESPQRSQARGEAAAWLAGFLRPSDVLWGYNPLYLQAFEDGGRVGDVFVPRADPKLALRTLRSTPAPLGRGVWILDASNGGITPRWEIEQRTPLGDDFASRAFGPFLVIWTQTPVGAPSSYLRDTVGVQSIGKELGVSDSDLNYTTALRALDTLEGR
jgi:hypothetical protein